MSDEQAVGNPAPPLPVEGELGQLAGIPSTEPLPPTATSASTEHSEPQIGTEYVSTFIGETHSYITQYIQAADQKAIFLFSASAALLAFLYQAGASANWLKSPSSWDLMSTIIFFGMIALAGAAGVAVGVVVPRLPGQGKDLVSFNGISSHARPEDYIRAVLGSGPDALLAAKLHHCHTLAGVCRAKYSLLRVAVLLEAIGVIGTMIYFLFGGIR